MTTDDNEPVIPSRRAPNGPRLIRSQVEKAERRGQALQLRRLGLDYREIGARLGIDHKTALRDVKAALLAISTEGAEEVRKLELARLDHLWMNALGIALREGAPPELRLKAIDTCLRISTRRAAMEGIDAPTKVEMGPWIQRFAEEQGLDAGIALEAAREIAKQLGF